MGIVYGDEKNFKKLIGDKKVLIDFYAEWCGPCKMLGPVLEEVSKEMKESIIVKVDIDKNMDLAKQYGIMSVPTMLIFKKGEEVGRHTGYMDKDRLIDWLNDN